MEGELATVVAEIESGFGNLRSCIERRAFDELQTHLCRQRALFQSLPADDPSLRELAQRGHQLIVWALENVRQYRSECTKTLAVSKQELQLLQSYKTTQVSGEFSAAG